MKKNYEGFINYLENIVSEENSWINFEIKIMETFTLLSWDNNRNFINRAIPYSGRWSRFFREATEKMPDSLAEIAEKLKQAFGYNNPFLEALLTEIVSTVITSMTKEYNQHYAEYSMHPDWHEDFFKIPDFIKIIESAYQELKDLHKLEVANWKMTSGFFTAFCNNGIDLLKALMEYDDSLALKYRIYGLSLRIVQIYNNVFLNNLDFYDYLLGETDISSDAFVDQKRAKLNHHIENFREREKTSQVTLFLGNVALKIANCNLLPTDLRTPDAALSISKYFENKRADSLKEAINLYYAEKKDEEEKEKQEKIRKEIEGYIVELKSLFEENMKAQEQNNAMIASIANAFDSIKKEQDEIVEKYNDVVDKHNDLVEEHNKLVNDLKNN